MLKAYKVEIKPTLKQIQKINQSIGVCRWLYNEYLAINNQLYAQFKEGLIDKKQAFNIPLDYEFEDNGEITYRDLYALINYEVGDGKSLDDEWEYLGNFTDDIEPL